MDHAVHNHEDSPLDVAVQDIECETSNLNL